MKLCNFASFDPTHARRGVAGLGNASRADRAVWDEFNADWNRLAVESEIASRQLLGDRAMESLEEPGPERDDRTGQITSPPTRTEMLSEQVVRLGQSFFRATVLSSFHDTCCMCGLSCKSLLVASHIIPWARRADLRLDPRNGLSLCALHDRAFDRGFVSLDGDFRLLISSRIEVFCPAPVIQLMFISLRGQMIRLPERFQPRPDCLEFHRSTIYEDGG